MTLPDVDPICVVIARTRHGMMQAEIQEAARLGAGLIELRLDFLKKAPDFKRLLANKPCPIIATVRRPPEGGKWDGSEEARRVLLRQAIVGGFDWVDLETDVADSIPRFGNVRRIVSYHNMREVPADLEKIHHRMCAQDADVVKIAVRAHQPADNTRVLALLKKPAKPTVAFCTNDLGFPSRILQAKFGAPFTYAAFNKERFSGLNIPSLVEIKKIYHYDQINKDTEVYGVIGDPVGHSLSPLIHNVAFRKLGINAVYLPFRVPREALEEFLRLFNEVPVKGYSVTIPHKEEAAAAAAIKDATVEQTQAANTLIRTDAGFVAHNTDYSGVIETLNTFVPAFGLNLIETPSSIPGLPPTTSTPPLPPSIAGSLAGRVVLVLGAGGVARAVANALHREGALVTISNRTSERALNLANDIGCRHVEWTARHSVLCDLVINCTPIGMHPEVDESPLHPSFLRPGLIVFDTVYTPEQTLLIKQAVERGCHIVTGVELFYRQAALQFEYFTGMPAPFELFRKLVRRAFSGRHSRGSGVIQARRVILIGPRGSGKTTVAALIAERLEWACFDADEVLEQRMGMTIQEVFAAEGQAGFRTREKQILEELCGLERAVIATGGGAVLDRDNRERMRGAGAVVWLTADAETLRQRLSADAASVHRRPALAGGGLGEIVQVLAEREPLYRECAHVMVETGSRPPEEIAGEVLARLL